jgi:hypothetical protein
MLGGGYFVTMGVARALDRWGSEDNAVASAMSVRRALYVVARDRWVWLVPLSVVGSIYLFLLFRPNLTAAYPTLYGLY